MDQLEKIIRSIREDAYEDGQNGAGQPHSIDNDKRAIKKLIKDLVAEAKPPYKTDTRGATQNPDNAFYHTKKAQGYNEAIDQFEQNLLEALEEV